MRVRGGVGRTRATRDVVRQPDSCNTDSAAPPEFVSLEVELHSLAIEGGFPASSGRPGDPRHWAAQFILRP